MFALLSSYYHVMVSLWQRSMKCSYKDINQPVQVKSSVETFSIMCSQSYVDHICYTVYVGQAGETKKQNKTKLKQN